MTVAITFIRCSADAAQQEVRDDVAAARTFAETVAHQARECASLGVESASHRAEALRALGVDVDMHLGDGYASDQPTGQTPKKRRVDVSPCVDDMRSKGEDELRAEFRRLQSVGQAPAVETPAMPVAAFHGQATSLDKENENAIAPSVGKHCHDSSGMHKEKVLCESNAA